MSGFRGFKGFGKAPTTGAKPASHAAFALGRLRQGKQNKTEKAYEDHLFLRVVAKEVLWYKFEGIKLRLADNTFLTVDFPVMVASGHLEMHEVKGNWWLDDARAKIKVAAAMYPFRFIGVKRDGKNGWKYEEF